MVKIPTDIHVSTRDWYVQYTLSLANSHCRQRSTTKSHWILLITFVKSRHPHCSTMNWFGKKKPAASTVSSGSSKAPSNPQGTIVTLRENIATQEKRWATSNFLIIHPYSRIQFTLMNPRFELMFWCNEEGWTSFHNPQQVFEEMRKLTPWTFNVFPQSF